MAKIDPCGGCGKRAKVNCVKCKMQKSWVYARCARVKKVSFKMHVNFECKACMNVSNDECNNVLNVCLSELKRVNSYYYLGNNMNGGRGSELSVTLRIRLE